MLTTSANSSTEKSEQPPQDGTVATRRQIAGPTVWDRDSLDAWDYMMAVNPRQAAACLRIRDGLRRRGRRLDTIEASDFQEPELAEIARGIRQCLQRGPGFCVLRGLPLQGWTDEEASMLYWGLGTYLGAPQPQNRHGDRVYLVHDTGQSVAEARGSKTNSELIFHTDSACAYAGSRPDVLGLLCLRKAVSGGESVMVSGHTVYNALLETNPDLVQELYGQFCFDRSQETEPGEDPFTMGSVFTDTSDGVKLRYNRLHIELGHYRSGNPLSDRQRQALDALDRALNDTANYVEFTLDAGDVLFADNHTTLHNRRAFVDATDVAARRCLVRLWLAGEPRNLESAKAGSAHS
ncbi:TauD/TfdA family dioxygenase [Mycobacterium asiaticum]|uniref:TauD/TfdA family dioxygenase n=1 Tax=Mycobacterium asiaticum TaxID=1790 RepID=UPI000B039B3E|nr:TauD/TfdA family dioxygenase [Mycobacterium asiaticum]